MNDRDKLISSVNKCLSSKVVSQNTELLAPIISTNQKNDGTKIGRLILVRHGQSKWNVTYPKTDLGYEQAIASYLDLLQI